MSGYGHDDNDFAPQPGNEMPQASPIINDKAGNGPDRSLDLLAPPAWWRGYFSAQEPPAPGGQVHDAADTPESLPSWRSVLPLCAGGVTGLGWLTCTAALRASDIVLYTYRTSAGP
jgi:hypothetical protein